MMNNHAHASHTGMSDSIVALLYGFAPAALLLMALYAGFCA